MSAWRWLMNWLPDLMSGGAISVGDMLQVVGGLAGTLLALVALAYAWRVAQSQDRVVSRQLALMEQQTGILERMEALEGRQADILKRQSEIAEMQHAAMVDSQYAQAQTEVLYEAEEARRKYHLSLRNRTRLRAVEFGWNITINGAEDFNHLVEILEGPVTINRIAFQRKPGEYTVGFNSHRDTEIVPGEAVRFAVIKIDKEFVGVLNVSTSMDVNFGMFRKMFQGGHRLEFPPPESS